MVLCRQKDKGGFDKMNIFKRWYNNQMERHKKYKNKEDEKIFTKCPKCEDTKHVEVITNYSWIVFLIGLVLILINVFFMWNGLIFVVGLLLAGYQSMKMLSSTMNGDKHKCNNCNHEWKGKGYGKNHEVVG